MSPTSAGNQESPEPTRANTLAHNMPSFHVESEDNKRARKRGSNGSIRRKAKEKQTKLAEVICIDDVKEEEEEVMVITAPEQLKPSRSSRTTNFLSKLAKRVDKPRGKMPIRQSRVKCRRQLVDNLLPPERRNGAGASTLVRQRIFLRREALEEVICVDDDDSEEVMVIGENCASSSRSSTTTTSARLVEQDLHVNITERPGTELLKPAFSSEVRILSCAFETTGIVMQQTTVGLSVPVPYLIVT